jgi:hypothetical protein
MSTDQNWKNWGVYIQPGIGRAYPELNAQLYAMYRDKVRKIPWLPSGWYDAVMGLGTQFPNDQIRIAPAYMGDGVRANVNAPDWLDTKEKRDAWQAISNDVLKTVQLYAAGQAAAGKAELDSLYAKAAFWNSAYEIAVKVRDFPKEVVGAVAGAANDVAGGVVSVALKKLAIPLLVVGVGALVWYNRSALARAAGKSAGLS